MLAWEAAPEESSPVGSRAGGWGCRGHGGHSTWLPTQPPEHHHESRCGVTCGATACGAQATSLVPRLESIPFTLHTASTGYLSPAALDPALGGENPPFQAVMLLICKEIKQRKESAQTTGARLCWAELGHRYGRIRNKGSSTQRCNADCINTHCI